MKKNVSILFFIALATILIILTGCGSSSPTATNNTTTPTASASQYVKLTAGNTWTWNASATQTVARTPTTTALAQTDTLGAITASGTPVATVLTTASGATPPAISYIKLDAAGNLIRTTASGTSYTYLPATFSTGTTYTLPASIFFAASTSSNITATIAGVNVARTVSGMAFNDVLQINLSGTINQDIGGGIMIPMTVTGSIYVSKQAGNIIELAITATGSYLLGGILSVPISLDYIQYLQPGYTAL